MSDIITPPDDSPDDVEAPAKFRYSAFFDLIADAAFQHSLAKAAQDAYVMNRHARASVLASALSIECASNCLLWALDLPQKLLEELDRLTPLAKIENTLNLRSVSGFDRGSAVVQRVSELIKVRNDHVHPKTSTIPASLNKPQEGEKDWIVPFSIEGERWSQLGIPKKNMFWSSDSSFTALEVISAFYKYLFIDLLELTEDELHRLLPSRIEFGNVHVLALFQEIRAELYELKQHGIDLSFFELFESIDKRFS